MPTLTDEPLVLSSKIEQEPAGGGEWCIRQAEGTVWAKCLRSWKQQWAKWGKGVSPGPRQPDLRVGAWDTGMDARPSHRAAVEVLICGHLGSGHTYAQVGQVHGVAGKTDWLEWWQVLYTRRTAKRLYLQPAVRSTISSAAHYRSTRVYHVRSHKALPACTHPVFSVLCFFYRVRDFIIH